MPLVVVLELAPPVDVRVMNVTPVLGVTATRACGELAVRSCRIMTPALAAAFVFCTESTLFAGLNLDVFALMIGNDRSRAKEKQNRRTTIGGVQAGHLG